MCGFPVLFERGRSEPSTRRIIRPGQKSNKLWRTIGTIFLNDWTTRNNTAIFNWTNNAQRRSKLAELRLKRGSQALVSADDHRSLKLFATGYQLDFRFRKGQINRGMKIAAQGGRGRRK